MSRWEPNASDRLQEAALQLYLERGFDQSTVAEIAERAGLTERTYFRYFADKREALFGGQAMLTEILLAGIADAPADGAPLDVIGTALTALGAMFDGRRDHARRRQSVIDANPALQERELIKLATLSTAMAEALRDRGIDDPAAQLAAETGMAVFKVAFGRWVHDSTAAGLAEIVTSTMDDLKALTAQ
ncbi:TetR family transcriptional regulator [Mycolicibacterium neworleansense]|uniref:TetR family transcriptional regulator n=1 Tax=Mycolicibacterium neworleansense TaxID=146018 RepID=A0A0H5RPW5_9MYCO|nr:TetR family transcriptional regulator [Mycolicibacterium neworleansense]MCV7365420.1 TetR family transcriptional regulator [Mycolicibacterium neworleansense]CRZ16225.1 TetR family transcriptional regulator [Mycolicibacterium neworleansense]